MAIVCHDQTAKGTTRCLPSTGHDCKVFRAVGWAYNLFLFYCDKMKKYSVQANEPFSQKVLISTSFELLTYIFSEEFDKHRENSNLYAKKARTRKIDLGSNPSLLSS